MLRAHRTSWLLLLVAGAAAGLVGFGTPDILAQDAGSRIHAATPLTGADLEGIHATLRARSTSQSAATAVEGAIERARTDAHCLIRSEGLERARQASEADRHDRAATLARAYLRLQDEGVAGCEAAEPDESTPTLAHLLASRAELERQRPTRSLDHLAGVEAEQTPIRAYVWWLKARALEQRDSRREAAETYERIYELETSALTYRARARQAELLAEAGACREAVPALTEMLELFPDYPRRTRLQLKLGLCHEALGQFRRAAETYQSTWLNFPHKPTGDRALARLETLERRGVSVETLSYEELFDRFRQLRIYRQWDLADVYFRRLLDRVSSLEDDPEIEHEIVMQLALNAFEPKRNDEALAYLDRLREAADRGDDEGIHEHVVAKYRSRLLARTGRFDDALAAQKRRLERYGRYSRHRELIDFYETHGRYEQAYQLADTTFSQWKKRRWRIGWLLYKTGRFERAVDHFERFARNRHGQARARGMYWAARAHARNDNPNQAHGLYNEIAREFPLDYYGVQALNRLRDLRQRDAVDSAIAQKTESVLDGGNDVFAAFDRAARAMADSSTPVRVDSSLVPRVPDQSDHASPQTLSPRRCSSQVAENRMLCRLMAGDLPEQTRTAIERAVAPFGAAAGPGRPSGGEAPADGSEAARLAAEEAAAAKETAERPNRIDYPTRARIYWNGRHDSQVAFASFERGEAIGPMPAPRAYGTDGYVGGLSRAVDEAGELFPALERAEWLYRIGWRDAARTALREAALEFRGLAKRPRPAAGDPHELPYERWSYLVDFRPRGERGLWGYEGGSADRFPVPDDREARRKLAERQQTIWDRRETLRGLLVDALKEVGDYHLVRKFTLEQHDLFDREPSRLTREVWMQAYPRAYPRKVIAESRKRGINPYLIWSLMGVESTYNPDSISTAEAIGLLQVIPRTGVKVATSIGDRDFGPYDLIDDEVAIEQGVWYFSRLVRKFRGQELLAMAGYNGGPHRVAAWMNKRGAMPHDEFVEEIPFTQARGYVKKVTRFLATYLRLYEDRKSLYIGQNVETDYRTRPNY